MVEIIKRHKYTIFKLSFFQLIIGILDLIGTMITVPILGIVSGLLDPEILFKKYYERNLVAFDENSLMIILIAYFLAKILLIFFINKNLLKIITSLQVNLQKNIFENLLNKKFIYYSENDSSKLIRDCTTEVSIFINKVLYPISMLLSEMLIIIAFLALLLYINIWLLIIILIIFLVLMIYSKFFQKNAIKNISIEIQSNARMMYSVAQEAFQLIKIILVYKNEDYFIKKFKFFSNKYITNANGIIGINFISKYIFELIFIFFIVLFLLTMKIYNSNNIPELFIGISAFGLRLLPSLTRINNALNDINEGKVSYEVIKRLW